MSSTYLCQDCKQRVEFRGIEAVAAKTDHQCAAVKPKSPLARRREEEDLLNWVIDTARMLGWHTAHFRPALTAKGWRTAVSGDGEGWPDLVLVRECIIYAELKSETGKLSPEQEDWRDWLTAGGGVWFQWRPSDKPEIERILQRGLAAGGKDEQPIDD